jgi:hypothetical protein
VAGQSGQRDGEEHEDEKSQALSGLIPFHFIASMMLRAGMA